MSVPNFAGVFAGVIRDHFDPHGVRDRALHVSQVLLSVIWQGHCSNWASDACIDS